MKTHQDKTYLVTGGTTGIGEATVANLTQRGAKVIATGRNPDTLERARATHPTVEFIASDAGSSTEIAALGDHLAATLSGLDGVVLNAGIAPFMPLGAWSESVIDELLAVNVKGPFLLLQQLAPMLNDGASVVFNTSVLHEVGMAGSSMYAATKGALRSMIRALSIEFAPRGVRVNAVAPGPIATPIYSKLGMAQDQLDAFQANVEERIPLGRFGDSTDIANAFAFLLSDESSYITGDEISVDGGMRNNVA